METVSVPSIEPIATSPARPAAPVSRWSVFVSWGAWLSVSVGLLGLAGWVLDIDILRSGWPGLVQIKANSAICLILLGVALWLRKAETKETRARILLAQLMAGLVAAIGLASFAEYLFGWNLGIDQLLFLGNADAVGAVGSGLMAPLNAVNFFLLGLALVLLDWTTHRRFWPSQLLSFIAGLLALFNLLDFILAPREHHTRTSLLAAIALAVFSLAVICARPGLAYGADSGAEDSLFQRWLFRRITAERSLPLRYGGAVALVAGAAILHSALEMSLGITLTPFITFYPAIFLAAAIGGLGPGGLATCLTGLAVAYFFMDPPGIGVEKLGEVVNLAIFLPTGIGVSVLAESLERTRRRSTETMRKSSLYARSLIEASLDPLVTISPEGKITDVNKATEDATGVTRSALIGTDFASYFTEPETARAGYREAFDRGYVTDHELALRHVSGTVMNVIYRASIYRDEKGAVAGVFAAARDITKRKKAEAVLRAASAYSRSLIEASLDPLVTISPEGKITDVNKATEEATGIPRSGLIGTDFASYFTEPEGARAGYRQVFDLGQVTDYPLALRHVSGKVTDVLYNASVYRDDNGAVAGVFAAARDVTERKRAETELRRVSQYSRSLIEASLDPLVTISPEGKITDINEATEDATGIGRKDLIGTDFASYFTEPERARAGYRQVFDLGQVTDYPLALRHVSGKVTEVLYNASLYRDDDGAVAGVFAAARDVTERKRAETELRRVSQYSRSLIEASVDPLVTISPEGKITDVNKATEEATGIPRSGLIGTDFASYFTEPERARAGYRQVFDLGQVTDYPLALRHVSGKVTEVLYNASLYRDDDGAVAGVFAAARDITERKRAEAELSAYRQHLEDIVAQRTAEIQTTNKRLEGANQELETFAYSVSHDLRTPLRAVDGFSRILIEDYAPKLDAEGQRVVNVVREATKKMAQMIDDILAFSRAGRLELSIRPIDMEELVREALKTLEPALAGSYVKVEIKSLPASQGDSPMIQRLWTNLLDNAIKFTRTKSGGLVQVGAQAGDNETIYYVKDNGVGFDMQYGHKLFGVFQRLHGPEEFPGTGIGLAIVKRIAERHGGRVWAEGKVGEGATIYFALPKGRKL